MGRPKTYERDTVTAAAMELFWQRGYHDVSTRELVDTMGINMNTLYTEFGTKAGLFSAAIEHYEQHVVPFYIGALEQPDAAIDTIRDVLNAFPALADTDDSVPGCLITNTATELAPTPEASHQSMARYIDRLNNAFVNALQHSSTRSPRRRRHGSVPDRHNARVVRHAPRTNACGTPARHSRRRTRIRRKQTRLTPMGTDPPSTESRNP